MKARLPQLCVLVLLMLGVVALTSLPQRRDKGPVVETRSGPALRLVAYEYGKPDAKNVTITLEWIGKGNHELSIGQPLPGTTLRFFGMKMAAAPCCILRSADNATDLLILEGTIVGIPKSVLR